MKSGDIIITRVFLFLGTLCFTIATAQAQGMEGEVGERRQNIPSTPCCVTVTVSNQCPQECPQANSGTKEEDEGYGTKATKAVKAAITGVATSAVVTQGLAGAGFTATGIAGGSFVAGLQSVAAKAGAGIVVKALSAAGFTASGIASGSVAAAIQSVAATGGLAMTGPVGIGVGVVGVGAYYIFG